ncbi:MAG TPA: type II toxin-antitoxin system Phd/YefM family antitoxin [Mycobacteriales bacterium]|nr:type II toxin-antitoxin system Phd/YefM family antitoxin [Mycobacteriales bacterium]
MKTLPLAEVRNHLSALVDEVAGTHEVVTITRNGVPTAVVVASEDYESIMETLALLSDREDQDRVIEAQESIAAGDLTTAEEMAQMLRDRS